MKRLLYPVLGFMLAACQTEQEKLTEAMDASHAAGRPVLIYKLGFSSSGLQEHKLEGMIVIGNTGAKKISEVALDLVNYNGGSPRPSPTGVPGGSYKYYLRGFMPPEGVPVRSALVAKFADIDRNVTCLRVVGMEIFFGDGTSQVVTYPDIEAYFAAGVDKRCGAPSTAPSWDYKAIGLPPVPPPTVHH